MPISPVGPPSSISAANAKLQAQSERDQQRLLADMRAQAERDRQRLLADMRARASEPQLAADRLAVARDRLALQHTGRPTIDTNL